MKAAICHRKGDIRIEERPAPVLRAGEALVEIKAVGVCGSDLHFYEEGRCGTCPISKPWIIGHECSGIVRQTAPDVRSLSPGDRVAVEPGKSCRACFYCRTGRYNLCSSVDFLGSCPSDGAMCEYLAMPQELLFRLPEEAGFEIGALVEPLAVGVHAAQEARFQAGENVLILGAGTIGLLAVLAFRAAGAGTVCSVETIPSRRDLAARFGAVECFFPGDELPRQARERIGGMGFDVVVEASGNSRAMAQSVSLVRRGGRVILVGINNQPEVPISLASVVDNAIEMKGIFRYANCFGAAVRVAARHRGLLGGIVGKTFPLEQAPDAFEFASRNKRDVLKVMIVR